MVSNNIEILIEHVGYLSSGSEFLNKESSSICIEGQPVMDIGIKGYVGAHCLYPTWHLWSIHPVRYAPTLVRMQPLSNDSDLIRGRIYPTYSKDQQISLF